MISLNEQYLQSILLLSVVIKQDVRKKKNKVKIMVITKDVGVIFLLFFCCVRKK